VSGYRERLFKFVEAQSVELSFSETIAPAKGLSYGGKITLLSGMQPAEEFSTLTHEIAHEMLHRGDRRTMTTKQVRETEAEAVAFVVCQAIGLETGTASADYVVFTVMLCPKVEVLLSWEFRCFEHNINYSVSRSSKQFKQGKG
jgi:hypothetical protein